MRTEIYKKEESGDDIKYAFENNGFAVHLDNIQSIVAEVCGENDGCDWYWLLLMKGGAFKFAQGGCDYTGWDCQSSASISDSYGSAEEAINAEAPEKDSYGRAIKETLLKQVSGEQPFGLYTEINKTEDSE